MNPEAPERVAATQASLAHRAPTPLEERVRSSDEVDLDRNHISAGYRR